MKRGVKTIEKVPCSKCFAKLAILASLIFISQVIFAYAPIFHNNLKLHAIVGNILITALSFICFISSIKIYKSIPINFPREKKGNLFLSLAIFLFFLGDLLWLYSEIFLNNLTPIGGLPDLMWNLGYFALIISIGYFISLSFRPSRKVTALIILAGLIVGGTILYLDVIEDFEEGSFDFIHGVQDAYILYDAIIIFMLIYLIWPIITLGNRFFISWIVLGLGISTRLIYDRIFAEMSEDGTYYTGHPVDILYTTLYLTLIISFYLKSKNLGGTK
jgi:hypothetical protein